MPIKKFIEYLKSKNIILSCSGDKLSWKAPKGALTPEIKIEIGRRKSEILDLLKEPITDRKVSIHTSKLIHGDCLTALKEKITENSIDLIVTDPPYGLEFMGKNWDKAIPSIDIWKECLRVLKPGAFAFIMCSPRQDLLCRMTDNLEKAGFMTGFTSIYWTYANGFPKAHNIGKAIFKKAGEQQKFIDAEKRLNGSYGGFQPKPAVEVILVLMKPLDQKCYTDQALSNVKGITWLDGCRIPYTCEKDKPSAGNRTCNFGEQEPRRCIKSDSGWEANKTGRFPANLLLSDNILDDYSKYYSLDQWSNFHMENLPKSVQDTSPFMIVSKPSKKEKEEGLENLEAKQICGRDPGQDMRNNPYKLRPKLRKNYHPTVKPLALITYLIKMGSREGEVVLDPFLGSGTTNIAACRTNRIFIGIEKEDEYAVIAHQKCRSAIWADWRSRGKDISGNVQNVKPGSPKESGVEANMRPDISSIPGGVEIAPSQKEKEKIMTDTNQWRPSEIIVHEEVKEDPATINFLSQCPNVPVKYTSSSAPREIIQKSDILSDTESGVLNSIKAGKRVAFISPSRQVVDIFEIADTRLTCPHFERLKLASNGCFYHCDWCYLKLTYRAQRPFMTIRVQYDKIKEQIEKRLNQSSAPIIFSTGELADSLSMEHLTGAMREFIPWFGQTDKGYMYLLTKSTNVDDILDLPHNGHSIITWSMNNEIVSRKYEIGAPGFEQRLEAAYKVQQANYPLRIRLDPIVPIDDWKDAYAETVSRIFQRVAPERMTLGTLRFEEGFYTMRNSIFSTGPEMPSILEGMKPMFEPKIFEDGKKPKVGKYSYSEDKRIEIFDFIIREIRKYSDCPIALCKESVNVWKQLKLDLSRCQCVCQLDYADMSK